MPTVLPQHIASAYSRVEPLTVAKGELLADAIYSSQPNLLASVLVLPKFGVTHEELDVVLKVLFICYESARESGAKQSAITEDIQEKCLSRIVGRARFLEGLTPRLTDKAVQERVKAHPEPHLLAQVYGILQMRDLAAVRTEAEKHLMLSALNIVETLAYVINDA